ncbi:tetratricopeptide repeat protein [Guyparkeria hydrothermalis]|uniref:tetratricopeptide repeat protein n=1 Tax=Guyparkeria hydrothermalis TaxID=923 RepID=UPI002020AFDC|nr:tetratricopeptide repeat protein [Guyparkeria hydrothermalis]MCL7743710.1 tetratricopeptide repeat protein [Guyparkeria hydrothermalis]
MTLHRKTSVFLLALSLGTVAGCSGVPGKPMDLSAWVQPDCKGEDPDGELGIRYDSIEGLMDSGRHRAALTHIQLLENDHGTTQRSQLWKAKALRQIGRLDEAQRAYGELTNGCFASVAYHGLGRTLGKKGDWTAARQALDQARQLNPISPAIHNDLGYARLKTGAYEPAVESFRTALELDAGRTRAANNLVLALLLMGEKQQAEKLLEPFDIPADRWVKLQSQADSWVVDET